MSLRAEDLSKLFGRDELELMAISCGESIIWDNRVMKDESGHEVVIVHTVAVEYMKNRLLAITQLHQPNYDGFLPVCHYDGEHWPCTTMRAGT